MVDPLEAMVDVLVAAGPFAYGTDQKLTQTAQEWLDMGFGPDEANDWLSVRCFHASVARDFANEDLEPDDLDITTPKPYPDTLPYKVCNNDVKFEVAVKVAKSRQG